MSKDPVDRLLSTCYLCKTVWLPKTNPDGSLSRLKICSDCGNPTVPEHDETKVN